MVLRKASTGIHDLSKTLSRLPKHEGYSREVRQRDHGAALFPTRIFFMDSTEVIFTIAISKHDAGRFNQSGPICALENTESSGIQALPIKLCAAITANESSTLGPQNPTYLMNDVNFL